MGAFLDLNNSPLLKMGDITRYSANYQARVETLSDHVAEVVTMSYIICLELKNRGEDINIGEVLEYAVAHDTEEVRTGDVVRSLKYYDNRVLSELRRVADCIESEYTTNYNYKRLYESWASSKEGKSGFIVKLVDMLCVVRKCISEVELLGNMSFLKITHEVSEYLGELITDLNNDDRGYSEKSLKYFRSLLEESISVTTNITRRHADVVKNYDLYNIAIK